MEFILLLLGGLGAFLVGIKLLSDNLEKLSGSKMKVLFEKTSNNKLAGVGIGALATALVQSSGLTTIMVVGFVNAGIMTLGSATAVIMGANIGTTITAQLASLQAFKFSEYAIALAGIGMLISLFVKKKKAKMVSYVIAGIGLIFVGLSFMSNSMAGLSSNAEFHNFLSTLTNPFLLFLIGIVITALVQSSAVITSIIITMAASNLLIGGGGNAVLFLIIGTNIGSCATALLSSIGASTNAKRASLIHLLFNSFGAVIFFIVLLVWPNFMDQTFGALFAEPSVQIAMFHTFFNVLFTALFLPFSNLFVRLSTWIIKDKEEDNKLRYLDDRFVNTPAYAIMGARHQLTIMLDMAMDSLTKAIDCFLNKNEDGFDEIYKINNDIIDMSSKISDYLLKVHNHLLTTSDRLNINSINSNIADIVRVSEMSDNIIKYTRRTIKDDLKFYDDLAVDIRALLNDLQSQADIVKKLLSSKPLKSLLNESDALEDVIDNKRKDYVAHHTERLNEGLCNPASGLIYSNLVCNLERAGDHLSFMAHSCFK